MLDFWTNPLSGVVSPATAKSSGLWRFFVVQCPYPLDFIWRFLLLVDDSRDSLLGGATKTRAWEPDERWVHEVLAEPAGKCIRSCVQRIKTQMTVRLALLHRSWPAKEGFDQLDADQHYIIRTYRRATSPDVDVIYVLIRPLSEWVLLSTCCFLWVL
jgi:hypothetical protein